ALSILFLRRCVGAGTLTVVRLPEPLLVRLPVCLCAGLLSDRLPVLLCAGLIGGGDLTLLSGLVGAGLTGSSRSGLAALTGAGVVGGGQLTLLPGRIGSGLTGPSRSGLAELTGSGLARPTGLAGSGLDGSTRLARPGWGRAVGSESGCAAGHIGHGGRVRRVL